MENVFEDKQRVIQEYVPGKQTTMAHLIANPKEDLYAKLGVITENRGAYAERGGDYRRRCGDEGGRSRYCFCGSFQWFPGHLRRCFQCGSRAHCGQ